MAKKLIKEIKTCRDWILEMNHSEVTDKDKEEILKIAKKSRLDEYRNNLSSAINYSFSWSEHPKGHSFWDELFVKIQQEEDKMYEEFHED